MIPPYCLDGPTGAPAVVLLPSLGTTSALWEPQLPALSARFLVVRAEQRGHAKLAGHTPPTDPPGHASSDGLAMSDGLGAWDGLDTPPGPYTLAELGGDVVDLLDHLGLRSASLCGVSLGGLEALWVAAHHPERVDRLVLACTAASFGPPGPWKERAAAVRASGTAPLLPTLLGRWFTPDYPEHHPEVASLVGSMLASVDPEGYAGCCEAIGGADELGSLGVVRAPTLVLAGADDPVSPPAAALQLQQGIPDAALTVLASAAHLANLEQAERFTAAVVDHLAGPVASRGEAVRRAVLGDAHVDRAAARATPMTAPFTDLITRYAWGDIWTRPRLDRKTRSIMTVALLAALGRLEELELHLVAARRNGLSDDDIAEVLLHTAIYAGVPAANAAFSLARRVLAEPGPDA